MLLKFLIRPLFSLSLKSKKTLAPLLQTALKINPHIITSFKFRTLPSRVSSLLPSSVKSALLLTAISQFDEMQNGGRGDTSTKALVANGKPESIEQDGPSEIFRDEDDSKVG